MNEVNPMEEVILEQPDPRMMNDVHRRLTRFKSIREVMKQQVKPQLDAISDFDQLIDELEKAWAVMPEVAEWNRKFNEARKIYGEVRREITAMVEKVNKLRTEVINLENEKMRQSVQGQGSRKSDAA